MLTKCILARRLCVCVTWRPGEAEVLTEERQVVGSGCKQVCSLLSHKRSNLPPLRVQKNYKVLNCLCHDSPFESTKRNHSQSGRVL